MNDHPSAELSEYLLEFQSAFIRNANKRRKTMVSLHKPRHARLLSEIWEAAALENVEVSGARRWKKIGFSVRAVAGLFIDSVHSLLTYAFRLRFVRGSLAEMVFSPWKI